jgi:inorganic pyrophosphatase
VRVKVLGCLAMIDDGETDWKVIAISLDLHMISHVHASDMIDDGETDWKVICINVNDPLAPQLNDIADVERLMPGYISVMREWLRNYKLIDGKPPNTFGLEERAMDRAYAMELVRETHQRDCMLMSPASPANDRYTMDVIRETHVFWRELVARGAKTV